MKRYTGPATRLDVVERGIADLAPRLQSYLREYEELTGVRHDANDAERLRVLLGYAVAWVPAGVDDDLKGRIEAELGLSTPDSAVVATKTWVDEDGSIRQRDITADEFYKPADSAAAAPICDCTTHCITPTSERCRERRARAAYSADVNHFSQSPAEMSRTDDSASATRCEHVWATPYPDTHCTRCGVTLTAPEVTR